MDVDVKLDVKEGSRVILPDATRSSMSVVGQTALVRPPTTRCWGHFWRAITPNIDHSCKTNVGLTLAWATVLGLASGLAMGFGIEAQYRNQPHPRSYTHDGKSMGFMTGLTTFVVTYLFCVFRGCCSDPNEESCNKECCQGTCDSVSDTCMVNFLT
jgi:hypothetical protein